VEYTVDEAAPGATRWEDLPQKTREHYEHAVALCTCEENQRDIDCVEHGFSRSNNYGDLSVGTLRRVTA